MKINLSKTILILLVVLNSLQLYSQGFIWIKGPNTTNASGLYGNVGTVNPGNNPGARNGAASWKDSNGNFWLFGGNGYDLTGNQGYLADLWKYDRVNNTWTWINGASVIAQVGIYGPLGSTSSSVHPGSRSGAVTWQDANGNVYLFGGYGYDAFATIGNLNDLWKYNPSTNQWSWISGNNFCFSPGNYGTIGVANSTNKPGARNGAVNWTDNNGDLWLFGGLGVATNSATTVYLNDLWKYNITSNQWTWMSGSNIGDQNGTYGSMGVSSATNIPGGRNGAVTWLDASGNFLMFGGNGFDAAATTAGYLNDLWKYNVSLNEWVWLKGSSSANQNGVYGTQSVASVSNTPGSRINALSWKDSYGNYWLSAGQGNSALNQGYLNDIWIYNAANNDWKWIAGAGNSNLPGVYGTMSTAGNSNVYGARSGSANWLDNNNNLWVFGGYGMPQTGALGRLADTWRYSNCVINPISMTITTSNQLPCANETLSLSVVGSNSYTWQTSPSSTLSYIVITPSVTISYSVITNNTNSCIYMTSYTQLVNPCLGLNENVNATSLLVYPNPTHGKLNVNGVDFANGRIKISNLTGQLIFEEGLMHNYQTLDLNLSKGIYFYQIFNENHQITKGKLIIE